CLLPVAGALLLMFALGLGFWASSIMVRYRDLRYVIPVAIQFLLYASPVGYSLEVLHEKLPAQFYAPYMLNPLASLIEFFRWTLLGEGQLALGWLAYSVAVALGIFVGGALMFTRAERGFADVL